MCLIIYKLRQSRKIDIFSTNYSVEQKNARILASKFRIFKTYLRCDEDVFKKRFFYLAKIMYFCSQW